MLLKPVGGKGQEALLSAPVRVIGLPVAAAYLAAGGSPVHAASLGFGMAVETPEVPPAGLVARSVHAFPEAERLAVAIGGDGIAYRAGGCHACFVRTAQALGKGDPSVRQQALGALAWQRIVLGLADALGASPGSVLRCAEHA